jgi:predicted ATPase/DNA-binding SARP family transcriptional activator
VADRFTVTAFGPVAVRTGDRPIDLSAGLASAIVARLALAAGRTLTTDQLVSALWEEPPTNAAGSLRVYVSRLRGGPLAAVLHGGRGGYTLDVDRADVDVLRFGDLVDGVVNDPLAADDVVLERLTAALELWTADPFDDLPGFPFVAEVRDGLRERRRTALERLAPLRVEAGDAARAVVELGAVVQQEPHDEGLAMSLARALAATGRASDAIATLDGLRDTLRDEGLDPSERVERVRQAILRQDASLLSPGVERAVVRHNIPVPLTRLVGRQTDLERVESARVSHRLVTIVGPGGVGKTRLAVESARRATRTIDAEQWMVDLSSVAAGGDVLAATADALGAALHTIDGIASRLEGRPTLLVLDNAEHVLTPTRSLVTRLLENCAGLAVLVTSREPLAIPGEFVIRVEGLAGESGAHAVELFRERSTAARGGSAPGAGEDAAIRRLCRLLDGLPLALELAAARTDALSVDDLSSALGRGERLPGDGPADERHASLENTIRWSTDSLPEDESALLVELSNFAGPFTLDALERICTPRSRPLRDLAIALARKSLVAVDETENGQRRYRLLESMKAYVRPLRDAGATAEWYVRHRSYFADLVDELAPAIRSHSADVAHGLFDTLAPDLQLATEHAIEAGDRDAALRLAGGQSWHWFKRGWLVEGRAVIDRALGIPHASDPAIEARALVGIVNLAYQSGDAEAAFEYVRVGIERATEGGDRLALASLLAYVAYGRSLFGEPDEAERLIEQAMTLSEGAPDWLRSELLMSKGQTLRALGRPSLALDSLAEARVLARKAGHAWALTSSEYVAGKILLEVQRAREAVPLLANGARSAAKGGDFPGALALLHLVGGATAFLERHEDGAAVFGAVDAIGRRYSYNPVDAEGADAQVHRDRVASGLTPREYDAAYDRGSRMSLPELLALGASLTRSR